jgi:dCTP deaminase
MIVNGAALLAAEPIKNMATEKHRAHGVSYGMSEAGYDIRIKQEVKFLRWSDTRMLCYVDGIQQAAPCFTIASAIEEFHMPENLVGIVHDKSTWARKGLSMFNTVIEPGWEGFLTLELVYHGHEELIIPAGAGIAQVIFHETERMAAYDGKYQGQDDRPVEGIME